MKGRRIKALIDAIVGALAVGMLRTVKRMDRRRTADFAGWLMRKVGRKEQRGVRMQTSSRTAKLKRAR